MISYGWHKVIIPFLPLGSGNKNVRVKSLLDTINLFFKLRDIPKTNVTQETSQTSQNIFEIHRHYQELSRLAATELERTEIRSGKLELRSCLAVHISFAKCHFQCENAGDCAWVRAGNIAWTEWRQAPKHSARLATTLLLLWLVTDHSWRKNKRVNYKALISISWLAILWVWECGWILNLNYSTDDFSNTCH